MRGHHIIGGLFFGVLAIGTSLAVGHETDQYTLPGGRVYADLTRQVDHWFYDRLVAAVDKLNARIDAAAKRGDRAAVERLHTPGAVAAAVNGEFPWAMDVIESWDRLVLSRQMAQRYPGRLPGYKIMLGNTLQHIHFPLDPRQFFRIWLGATMHSHGVYYGVDKIGHFTDMGFNYFRDYTKARDRGEPHDAAVQHAIDVSLASPIFSESGILGYASAGAYSNADLASDLAGLYFYLNLTEPLKLRGRMRPAMLKREGDRWTTADHVRRDSSFMALFITEHWDEALNPSHYEKGMRRAVIKAVGERAEHVMWRYRDANDCYRGPEYFNRLATDELATLFGDDYRHRGDTRDLHTLGVVCYALPDDDAKRNVIGLTRLHLAVVRGEADEVQRLLDGGVDPDVPVVSRQSFSPEWGNTPLHYAARDDRGDIARLLIARGAKVDATNRLGVTPLHKATRSASVAGVLLDRGANVNATDKHGRTPLHWASADPKSTTRSLLLRRGASVNATDHRGRTPLHDAADRGDVDALSGLISVGADPAAADRSGITPMHLSLARDAPRLGQNTDAAARTADRFGYTPLHVAAKHDAARFIANLLAAGALVDARDTLGSTPLHVACRYGGERVAIALIERGANVNATNRAGVTPLHHAAFDGNERIVKLLLDAGASTTAKDKRGRTPAATAKAKGRTAIAGQIEASNP